MKKAVLSIAVIGLFLAYSLALRFQHAKGVVSNSLSNRSTSTGGSGNTGSNSPVVYKDGTYTGQVEDAFYGNVQVLATISGARLSSVRFLQYPNESPNSQDINAQATPLLKQEAIKAQSAHIDIVSGATQTSQAFAESLQTALKQAET